MSDLFEQDLIREFGEPPEAPDADIFHDAVMRRIARRQTARRWTLAGAGLGGLAVAAAPVIAFAPRVLDAGHAAGVEAHDLYGRAAYVASNLLSASPLGGLGVQGWMVWAVLGLMAVGVSTFAGKLKDI
jgi:hypothetical protein